MRGFEEQRRAMVEEQIAARGVRDPRVLEALGEVPREEFVPERLRDFAYDDTALPIEEEQTISQPLIVAQMLEALHVGADARVLEVGTGSGYAAAVASRMVAEIYTIERHEALVVTARARFRRLGYDNIHVICSDGTLGWEEHAPYDGIMVAAAGPEVPEALLEQLAPEGSLVIPVGRSEGVQELVRVRREASGERVEERLGSVRFVPLIGVEGFAEDGIHGRTVGPPARVSGTAPAGRATSDTRGLAAARAAEPFEEIEDADLGALIERIGDARVVLLGESTHGTSEFYRMRARISRVLIERHGFTIVAVEADWPDARRIDSYVRGLEHDPAEWQAFGRFPVWMWRNAEVRAFVDWLHERNAEVDPERRAGFYGLDLYSLYTSIGAVLDYLREVDPEAAALATRRYGCLDPWIEDPAVYGAAVLRGRLEDCESEVVEALSTLLRKRMEYRSQDGFGIFDAEQNARLVANAERYYRIMYHGSRESWNLRDGHMAETLERLLEHHGPDSRAVVWAHNSHIGDASATEMARRGETNLGQLSRERFGSGAHLVGFGTDHGTVAAAQDWGQPMEVMRVRPGHPDSYEHLFDGQLPPRCVLPLLEGTSARAELLEPRLERAIGVVYRPATERASHYFSASIPEQFDQFIWFDESSAITPLAAAELAGVPRTYPFAL